MTNGSRVVIIDSGICNLFNVKGAFGSLGADVVITRSRADILGAPRVVLPGVGAFGAGMQSLERHDLVETIQQFARSGKPLMGICLGMQLMLTASHEHGVWKGLGVIRGEVRSLVLPGDSTDAYKVPQIGWNYLERPQPQGTTGDPWRETVLDGLGSQPCMYFVHSYVVAPEDEGACLAWTSYGRDRFCSVIRRDNISACQFHPERSGEIGLRILRNFMASN